MAKTNKKPTIFSMLLHFFSSKVIRIVTLFILLICSMLCMFLMDEDNIVRDAVLPFLNSNFIANLMIFFNIGRYNVSYGAWLLYICFTFIALVMIIGSIFSHRFVDKNSKANEDNFKSPKSARLFFTIIYYSVLVLICAAIILITALLGGFNNLTTGTTNVFLSLLYTMLIAFAFLLIIPITVFLAYFLIRLLVIITSYIISLIMNSVKDMNAKTQKRLHVSEQVLEDEENSVESVSVSKNENIKDASASHKLINKDIFLPLTLIDNAEREQPTVSTEITLNELALRFQAFAISQKIYYKLPLIRSYIAGLATSRLIILEGLSGTGKSMLPRMFAEFTSSKAFFTPVQATYRDKTDLLGYYSDFSKSFKITDFMKNLYSASYTDKVTELVLDEINLSRMEYYFADFLSILEYPEEEWKIKVYDPEENQKLPAKLQNGYITIPNNVWFIGTANIDDSTFTITDKVYDRAVVMDFKEKIEPIASNYDSTPITLSSKALQDLFDQAKNDDSYKLSKLDLQKFIVVCEFIKDSFEIKFGNRIMNQIEQFVPVYTALGGTKEEALDFMLARKILRKLNGAYQDYIKEELIKLQKLIEKTYGKGVFKETETLIAKTNKRLV